MTSPRDPGARDGRLGAALRRLPVPEHRPGFWDDVDAALAGDDRPVVRLDEERTRRRRWAAPLTAAAAAVTLVVAATGAVLWTGSSGDGQVGVAGRPGAAATPALFSAAYDHTVAAGDAGSRRWELAVAADGSYRWTAADGRDDYAYDAAAGEATELHRGGAAGDYTAAAGGVPPGGPDQRIVRPEPLGPLADVVAALGRAGDDRVLAVEAAGRPAWRYDGPVAPNRLGPGSPDRAVATVDRATGVLLELRLTSGGRPVEELAAVSVEVSDEVDRSRFRLDVPAGLDGPDTAIGFERRTLEELPGLVDYPVLVPGDVPGGFTLDAVTVNRVEPSPTGPEGMNPAVVDVVALRWRDGFSTFTVTLRPAGSNSAWDDPFGAEGVVTPRQDVRLPLPEREPLIGEVVVHPPAPPHLWGTSGHVVVTVDGDLDAAGLRRVAGSLRPMRP